jgi:hypothetical protein
MPQTMVASYYASSLVVTQHDGQMKCTVIQGLVIPALRGHLHRRLFFGSVKSVQFAVLHTSSLNTHYFLQWLNYLAK